MGEGLQHPGQTGGLNPIPDEPVQLPHFDPPALITEPLAHTPAWRRLEDILPPRLPAFVVLVLILLLVVFILYRRSLSECDSETLMPSVRDTAAVGTALVTFLTIVTISCLIIQK